MPKTGMDPGDSGGWMKGPGVAIKEEDCTGTCLPRQGAEASWGTLRIFAVS